MLLFFFRLFPQDTIDWLENYTFGFLSMCKRRSYPSPLKLPLSKRPVSGILGIKAKVAWVQHIAFFRLPQKSCWLIVRTTKSSNLADKLSLFDGILSVQLKHTVIGEPCEYRGKAARKMLGMEGQERNWVNYLSWEDGLQLCVKYWRLSYTPSPLGWSKVEPSPLALKRKDWIVQVVDCNISLHLIEI